MSKNYQKAARGWLYALAAVIAGTCFSVSPAQSATCFLPSGECSTGKIGAGPSGGESTPEYCVGYNITEKEYNAKYKNTSCFICSSPCTKTSGGTFYKCEAINNTTWYDKYNVCCTDGTKYDADDGKCCAGGKCDHPCPAGKQWSPTFKQCVCPSNLETDGDGNCCAAGQVLDNNKKCTTPCTMNDCGDYPYTSDPGNSEYCDLGCGKGMRYKCRDGYTYSNGSCIVPPSCPTGYSTKYQSVNDCGTTGAKGYDFDSKGTLNGKVCGRCTTTNCEGAYGPGVTAADCKEGEVYSTNGYYDGEDICGLCSKPTEIKDIYIWAEEYKANGLGYYYLKASEAVHTNLTITLSVDVYHDERGDNNGTVSSQDGCQMQAGLASGQTVGEKDRCDKMTYNDISANNTQFYINYKDTGKPEWDNKVIDGYRYHWKEITQVVKPTITITLEYDSNNNAGWSGGSESSSIKFTNTASDGKSYTVKLIIYGDGDNGINYPLTATQGNWVTYSSRYWETSDNDYGGSGSSQDRETSSEASSMSVVINSQTVKTGLPVTGLAGKSYTTDNYIIKFAEVNCSKYYASPWVVNGSDNSVKCRAINSGYAPCGEQATCGGTQYVECKAGSQCGNGGGSSGNSCTASTYTASVTCSLSYSTDECCTAFGCSGKGCGTGYFNCVFDVPSCAFSSVSIHATDSIGQDHIVASAGAGQSTRVLNNYQIPGSNTPCEFFASSSSLGKVKGEAVSGQSYTWKCSYTRKIR